ncbi:MAG: hypothetical protein HZA17_04535 [Nitrospirae bacterium]|nr:hypothetical protein [Nitrospirota bacterium]
MNNIGVTERQRPIKTVINMTNFNFVEMFMEKKSAVARLTIITSIIRCNFFILTPYGM